MSGLRRISIDDLKGQAPKAQSAADPMDIARVLGNLSKGLTEIASLQTRMDAAEAACAQMLKVCDKTSEAHTEMKARLGKVDQYLKDHADTHRDMGNAHGKQVEDLLKLVRNVTGQFAAMQDTVGSALKDFANRRDVPIILETRVNAPAVTVQNNMPAEVETESEAPCSYTFDIKRNQGGLIQSVVARPGVDS